MSDQTIQYDEEMVGAGHPTKSDTLNRLALVEADSDGHGKIRYLKEQTAEPAVPDGEGALFTADNNGGTCLYYKADNKVLELVSPDRALIPGFTSNLLITRPTTTELSLAPFVAEINGRYYYLDSTATITPTGTASSWIYIMVQAPVSGNVLGASEITWTETIPTRDAAKGNAFYSADGAKRCIAAWKLAATGAPLAAIVENGVYNFREAESVYGNSAPPDGTLIPIDLGIPFAQSLKVYFNVYVHALTTTTYLSVLNGDSVTTADSWRCRALRLNASTPDYIATSRRTNAAGEVQVIVSGSSDSLYLAVHEIEMPSQIAR